MAGTLFGKDSLPLHANTKITFCMKKISTQLILAMAFLMASLTLSAQTRRPIDSQHPLWMVHIDVWNQADPQKIIDLIPDDIKPYVCMNLSLSCSYKTDRNVYEKPQNAVRTYKSWASVCQLNGLWFTCQPASGGHTHIQDDDLETFEYFFKAYPNFLGWNYAEQFWGFDEPGDKSSSTQASRIALFAKLVPMHHQYGGVLTVSFCGNIWSHPLNPIGMMKRNKDLLKACQDYPEAILWLYKYTTSSCFYNNESVTFGPFIAGLANNYGVRYDNCGWNGALGAILGDGHGKKYPGAAGIGTVMEQTCVNGGAVWDGPELIWTEDFKNLNDTQVDGYTRRNWGIYSNFQAIWLDMWRKIIDGTMYIPTREEVVNKTKIVVINNVTSGSDEDKYATWGDLYDGLYKQTDPFNKNNGQWMDNYCYFKKTGRYGAIPMVPGLYDDLAKSIPVQVKKSARWSNQTKKVSDFNAQYPEVSTGDLYVNRYKNQLVTYTPYTYLNSKTSASAKIPLQYNTCETLELTWDQLSSGLVREYSDHIDFYLNNFRDDITTQQTDKIVVTGVASEPTYTLTKHRSSATGTATYNATATASYDAEAKTYTLSVKHRAPVDVTINCAGTATERNTDPLPATALPTPKQPEAFVGSIVIEAENMDYKSIKSCCGTSNGNIPLNAYPNLREFAGLGFIDMGTNTAGSLRHQLKLKQGGEYDIYVRYCNTTKSGNLRLTVNGKTLNASCEKVKLNEWHKAKVTATMKEGTNNLVITNTSGIGMYIDQIIYTPAGTEAEKFAVTIRDAEHGKVEANVKEASEGETVTLTVTPDAGYALKELRVVNSVYFTQDKTIPVADGNTITFTMIDDNMTIKPVFADATAVYTLDFSEVLAGTVPQGWRATQGGNEVHEYPNSYSSGARTFSGFTGYQGKAFYWRDENAEYGKQTSYPLNLQPGEYKFTFAMAAWKGNPKYKAQILDASGNAVVESNTYTASPNANGNTSASIKSAKAYELPFTIEKAGKYTIRFVDMTSGDAMHEFLLAECRINTVQSADAILAPQTTDSNKPAGIYSPSGLLLQHMQPGLNIIKMTDGTVKKVYVK